MLLDSLSSTDSVAKRIWANKVCYTSSMTYHAESNKPGTTWLICGALVQDGSEA